MKFHLTANMYKRARTQWYADIIDLFHWSLRDLGYTVTEGPTLDADATNIVFAWQLWGRDPVQEVNDFDIIAYQSEQLLPGGFFDVAEIMQCEGYHKLKRPGDEWYRRSLTRPRAIWDYSWANVEWLHRELLEAEWVPPRFHPRQIDPIIQLGRKEEKDIPILFYGWINDRRQKMVDCLKPLGIEFFPAGLWGAHRSAMIRRSKIVLHVHWYPAAQTPHLRLSPLLANSVPVVCETCIDNPYGDAMACADYDDIPDRCAELLADDKKRRSVGERGYAFYSSQGMNETLRRVINLF